MTIIADATALILLAKASVLETFLDRNDVVTSEVVYEEVAKGKEKGRADSMLVERLVKEHKLSLKNPVKSVKDKISKFFNIHKGELDVVSLAYKTNHTVLTDDKKCFNAAKALRIGFITSLDVVIALFKREAITKEKALECLNNLDEYGWYSKDLIKSYKEEAK